MDITQFEIEHGKAALKALFRLSQAMGDPCLMPTDGQTFAEALVEEAITRFRKETE